MNKLYQLTELYRDALASLPEEADEALIIDTLDSIDSAIEQKAVNIVAYTRELDARGKAIDDEIERLKKRKEKIDRQSVSLKNYLHGNMDKIGKTKIVTDLFTISIQKNRASVQILDEKQIPAKYQIIVPESYKIDKMLIASDAKQGIEIPGIEMVQGRRLVIA